MTDAVQAGRGLVDYPGLYPNATGTVVANISGVTAIPGPITLAALAAAMGSTSYQGTWNASTNTPTLASSVGTNGYYYVVSVAGTTTLNGIADWTVGDWAIYNGNVSAWQKVEGGATTMTVGTTTVTGGTSPYLLYNNAGVLGNTTTPAVTSLALGGATIGSNALAVTGTTLLGSLVIATGPYFTNDGRFAASSASIMNLVTNGIALFTNTGATAGVKLDFATDTTLKLFGRDGTTPAIVQAGTLALGGATIGSNALAVTGTTALGGSLLMGAATSITVASGGIVGVGFALDQQAAGDISTKAAGRIGFSSTSNPSTAPDTAFSRISAGIIGVGTGAAGNVAGGMQMATLFVGGVPYSSLTMGVATGSFGVGTGFNVSNAGNVVSGQLYSTGNVVLATNTGHLRFGAIQDTFVIRRAAANLNFGEADAALPQAQTLSVQSVGSGNADTAGAVWNFTGSLSTGNATGGAITFLGSKAGSAGSSVNATFALLGIKPASGLNIGQGGTANYLNFTGGDSNASAISNIGASAASSGTANTIWYNRNNGNPNITVYYSGDTGIGPAAALATTATDGFLLIPTTAGTPTGVSTNAGAGKAALVYDTATNQLWISVNGSAWKQPKTPAGAATVTWQ